VLLSSSRSSRCIAVGRQQLPGLVSQGGYVFRVSLKVLGDHGEAFPYIVHPLPLPFGRRIGAPDEQCREHRRDGAVLDGLVLNVLDEIARGGRGNFRTNGGAGASS
jgi:hypothetical protein